MYGKLFIPAHGYVDGDGDGRAVMGTEMGLQYSPKKSPSLTQDSHNLEHHTKVRGSERERGAMCDDEPPIVVSFDLVFFHRYNARI